jgi:endonuclease-3
MNKKQDVLNKLVELLDRNYSDAECTLKFSSPFQLLIATILSAQCTDERVNKVTQVLFDKCERPEHFLHISLEELMEVIKPTGFYRNKAKNIKKLTSILMEQFKGDVPADINELIKLPGVGRKTANVVLGNCFGIKGVVVDTHVQRILKRLGIVDKEDPEKIEYIIMQLIPDVNWTKWSHQMIAFGRDICKAKKPECMRCNLRSICVYYNNLDYMK